MMVVAIEVIVSAAGDSFLMIETCPAGFSWQRFGRTRFVFWEELDSIENNGSHSHHGGTDARWFFSFEIRLADRRRFVFGPYVQGSGQLARTIEEKSAPFVLARIRAEYRAGNLVDFGRIKVSEFGWFKYGTFVPWEEVSRIRVEDKQWLCIECDGKPVRMWQVTSLNKIRNFHVLVYFLRELGWGL
jgi:hypothetical protein